MTDPITYTRSQYNALPIHKKRTFTEEDEGKIFRADYDHVTAPGIYECVCVDSPEKDGEELITYQFKIVNIIEDNPPQATPYKGQTDDNKGS